MGQLGDVVELNISLPFLVCKQRLTNFGPVTKQLVFEVSKMQHRAPSDFSDRFALAVTMFFRWFADTFFAKRYGHRAVVLETVAGVPGMVAGMWSHLSSLRKMKQDDKGCIRTLLDEAENERMHLMIFLEIAKPSSRE